MRSSKRCVGAARTAGFTVLLAVALATVNAAAAGASQFGMEGTDAVVRFDPGEQIQLYNSLNGPSPPFRIETNAATGAVTATTDVEPFFGGAVPPSTNPWGLAAPRAGAGCAPGTGRTVVCPLAGVQRIRVEFGTAAGVGGRVVGQVRVLAAALPVVVQGGPNGNFAAVATTGPETIDGGDR